MNRPLYRLNITGKNANEIYTISFPDNLLKFIKYDFAHFLEKAIELCRVSMKNGAVNRDEMSVLKSSITPCHRYYEKNTHGIFDRIVIDCWIDYICKQNEINTPTLWNSFSGCRNDFETTLFARLCEFRYNHAINQWVNILRVQEYARKKTDFIFGKKLENQAVAVAKAGYFDLLFNVAANEMGYSDLSTSKVYSNLRTPNSPFIMSGISREMIRNLLHGISCDDSLEESQGTNNPNMSDKSAMDAFTAIKNIIPDEADNIINTIMKSIPQTHQRVYIPESFKAFIDLETDALIESGAVIQKCGRCLEYFLKDIEYNHDYCSRTDGGRTCLDIMCEKMAATKSSLQPVDSSLLYARCDQLYKEMSARVNVDMNQRDFSDWYKYMALIRENVTSGQASMDDFENFVEYSRSINFVPQRPKSPKSPNSQDKSYKKKSSDGVRSFNFEKVSHQQPNPEDDSAKTLADLYGIDLDDYEQPDVPPAPPIQHMPYYSQYPPPHYAPPPIQQIQPAPNTTRIIRGMAPSGIRELPQPEIVTLEPPPLPEPPPVLPVSPPAPPPVPPKEEVNLAESEYASAGSAFGEAKHEFDVTPVPSHLLAQLEQVVTEFESPPPHKTESALLQNPYLRSIINSEEVKPPPVSLAPKVEFQAEPKAEPKAQKDAEVAVEAVPQLDFNSILSGIKRNDAFTPDITEEAPASHKTKRVMEAIFGKNKTVNPYIKEYDD
jgi:hypothetical protein